ncbi:DUF4867 family protein [Treponema zioleckii]|uniref:DUF4867 family protein n=1 Tax=Treponema zioleckii TaxID=331680 RepID=UPI00168B6500|nr:DUF4867 family protein [Treponema zioleckii]
MSHKTLERLNEVNDVPIHPVTSQKFSVYGRIVTEHDFSSIYKHLKEGTEIPQFGNVYVASDEKLESLPVKTEIQNQLYGGMPVQIGYCNGKNTTFNGFEYHKGSEINIAATDCMLVLGRVQDINFNDTAHGFPTYRIEQAEVFFVEKHTAIELYQTTLHLSPCRTNEEGFKVAVVLPRGTNTPLEQKTQAKTGEGLLLLQKNKWVIAHPKREPLIKQGACPGCLGENKELRY